LPLVRRLFGHEPTATRTFFVLSNLTFFVPTVMLVLAFVVPVMLGLRRRRPVVMVNLARGRRRLGMLLMQ
jgi:hypothetical protein